MAYTDDFNRGNEALEASANWSEQDTTDYVGGLDIVGNSVDSDGAGMCLYRWDGGDIDTAAAHYAQAVGQINGGGAAIALPDTAGAGTGYSAQLATGFGRCNCYRINDNGTLTEIATGNMGDGSGGETVKIERNGSTIKGYVDGVEKSSATDSNHTGAAAGICSDAGETVTDLDDWEAGPEAAVPTELVPNLLRRRQRGDGASIARVDVPPAILIW